MIYIDFEKLGTKHAKPALLGVLSPAAERHAYTVNVLDERLAPAAAARKYCVARDLLGALRSLLKISNKKPGNSNGAETDNDDIRIVSWSEFDLDVVLDADLPEEFRERFRHRWVNALATVRPWKARLYPEWKLPSLDRADDNSDGHALKAYMKAIGYQVPAALARGNAARWLRHVYKGMEARRGNYRQLSARSKRHWHALLEYNRHDCEGMRQVYERAARELALERAYRATTYFIHLGGARYKIRIGRPPAALATRLREMNARGWCNQLEHVTRRVRP